MSRSRDMTTGVEWKHILLFSLPIMAGNLLQQLYNTVDGIVVGNFVGEQALAAVGSCTTLTFVFLAMAMGLSSGSGIVIAQLFGAKRMHDLKSSVSTALILLFSVGLFFSVFGVTCSRWLLHNLINIEEGILLDYAVTYFRICSVGFFFQFGYNVIAAILRSVGDSKATLYFLCVSAVMNLVLDLLFVIVFKWGVAGAAIATVFAQACCVAVSLIYMFKKYPMFRFTKGEFRFDIEKCKLCLRLGIPTTIQQCFVAFGNVFIQRLVNSFGPVTMAAVTVGMRIENYIFIPIMGFGIGISTFTGQNMGAGKADRVKRAWRSTQLMGFVVCIAISVLVNILAEPLARLFGVSGETLAQSVENVRFLSYVFFIFSIYMTTNSLLQGAGDALYASICTLTSLFVRVVMAYAMAGTIGYSACWKANPIGWSVCITLALFRYFSGAWQKKAIVKHMPEEA